MGEQKKPVMEWRILAERDLSVAEHLASNMKPVPAEVIAFHCQQAVEKYLKGVLVILGEDTPHIHDLSKLCKQVMKYYPSFSSILSQCTIINQFSVQPRYDIGLSLSEDDLSLVLAHTKTIKNFLMKETPGLFQNGG